MVSTFTEVPVIAAHCALIFMSSLCATSGGLLLAPGRREEGGWWVRVEVCAVGD